jgi:hypothetical protein
MAIETLSTKIQAPQGMCLLRDILAGPSEDDCGRLRVDLARDLRWAFAMGPDGLIRIPVSYWLTPGAYVTFESGMWMHCRLDGTYAALAVAVLCAGAPEAADDVLPDYIPPFVQLMLAAVRDFNISTDNPSPLKKQLVDYFTGKVVDGQPVSPNLAAPMATLCRAPKAMNRKR